MEYDKKKARDFGSNPVAKKLKFLRSKSIDEIKTDLKKIKKQNIIGKLMKSKVMKLLNQEQDKDDADDMKKNWLISP